MSGALHVWELQCKVGRRKKREDTHEQGEGHPPLALGEGVEENESDFKLKYFIVISIYKGIK